MRCAARALLWAAMVVLAGACNYDTGACWTPSEDGQGGAAGGPIVPGGAGGFGNVTLSPQDASDATQLVDVHCPKSQWGADCMITCAQNGHPCPAGMKHTKTNDLGLLYRCNGCKGDRQCWYAGYSNPSDGVCLLRPETGALLCR